MGAVVLRWREVILIVLFLLLAELMFYRENAVFEVGAACYVDTHIEFTS